MIPAQIRGRCCATIARRLSDHGVAALGGKLYAVGGYQDIPSAQVVRTGAVYNPPPAWGGTSLNASGDWAAIADMNEVRGNFGLVAAGAKLYAVAGTPDGGASQLFERGSLRSYR